MEVYKAINVELSLNHLYSLNTFSFSIEEGETVIMHSLFNESEEILNMLYLKRKISKGTLLYYSNDLNDFNNEDIEEYRVNDCAYVDLNESLFNDLTVELNLSMVIKINRLEEDKKYLENIYSLFNVDSILNKKINDLTNYEIVRVKTVRALLLKPFVLLLNKVTALLTIKEREDYLKKINTINSIYKMTIIHATSLVSLLPYASKKILIEAGSLTVI